MKQTTVQSTANRQEGRHAVAALTFDISSADGAVQLLPAGEFRAQDGRPAECAAWRLTEANAPAVLARATRRSNKFVIDYEHQTQLAEKNGQPAPAAAWFAADALQFRPGEGLFATGVEWTPRAAEFVRNKEYRYISAVFGYDQQTGDVLFLVCAALTNNPALDGMDEVTLAALSARFSADPTPASTGGTSSEHSMNPVLKALLTALGLADTATEQEATSAVASLKAAAGQVDGLNVEIAALKSAAPDPAKYVPIDKFTELSTQLVALKAADAERQVEDVIAKAKAEGKVVPAVEDVWRAVGKSDLAQLKKLVDATPANPALAGGSQTGGEKPGTGGAKLDEAQLAICKQLGLTPEQFAAGAAA